MAATDRIVITIIGKDVHASTPRPCVDPVVIAAEVIMAIQTIHSRKVNPSSIYVISLCPFSEEKIKRLPSRQGPGLSFTVRTLSQGIEIPDAAFDRGNLLRESPHTTMPHTRPNISRGTLPWIILNHRWSSCKTGSKNFMAINRWKT